jgi:cell division protein FtsI (penicillin-binding protein 3)
MIPVVNDGTLYPITLIKDKNKHLVGKKVFSEHTSEEMRKLFRLVVTKGTGRKAGVNGYLVGGKTGTANKLNGKKYASNNKRISSFFAIFPSIKPEYIVYIIFDEPKGTKESGGFATGGWTAAPAVGRVIERMGVLYGLQPCDEQDDVIKQLLEVEYEVNDAV